MSLRFASSDEITNWDTHILANPDKGSVFQGRLFAEQKKLGGWKPLFMVWNETIFLLALSKKIPGIGTLWYAPKGPGVESVRQLDELLEELHDFAQKNGAFAVKIEPELLKEAETTANLLKMGLVKVPAIQPNASTVLIDLTPPLNDILAGLNQKGRHAIKRAERDGVTVKMVSTTEENCQIMYSLLAKTAEGNFRIRPYAYYKAFWQRYQDAKQGQLFFAYVDTQVVAAAFALIFGSKSTYKDGASVRERPAYGASHLLQWHVAAWAKERGSIVHDLCGTPPSDRINDTTHPHYGIGRFKTSFNKSVTDYVGAFDLIIRPQQYKLWQRFGEKLVTRLHSKRYNESYY